jgi:hypothetical protein
VQLRRLCPRERQQHLHRHSLGLHLVAHVAHKALRCSMFAESAPEPRAPSHAASFSQHQSSSSAALWLWLCTLREPAGCVRASCPRQTRLRCVRRDATAARAAPPPRPSRSRMGRGGSLACCCCTSSLVARGARRASPAVKGGAIAPAARSSPHLRSQQRQRGATDRQTHGRLERRAARQLEVLAAALGRGQRSVGVGRAGG